MFISCILQFYKDSKLNNSNENLFDASVSLWKNYSTAWIKAYNEFIKYYINLTENWLRLGTAPQLNAAFGAASMVNEVDIIGANVSADKQITVSLRYRGNGSSPAITVGAGAVRFNLADFLSISKPMMMMGGMRSGVSGESINKPSLLEQSNNSFAKSSLKSSSLTLSGKSKLDADWKSPATVIIELEGNTTLDDANFIGIRVHK
jgi:hypothetical protein